MKNITLSILILLLFASCKKVAREILAPNRCKKCAVIDDNTGDTLSIYEGCGAGFVDVEDDATITAFHCIKNSNNCNVSVSCTTWKNEDDE